MTIFIRKNAESSKITKKIKQTNGQLSRTVISLSQPFLT